VFPASSTLRRFLEHRFGVAVGNQTSPQLIYFGTERSSPDLRGVEIPVEAIAGIFFVLIALTFIGLGQALGRAFDAIPDRVRAYTVDVLGSLSGIVVFGLLSYFQTSPVVWFGLAGGLILYLLRARRVARVFGALSLAGILIGVSSVSFTDMPQPFVRWSPYYKVQWDREGRIETNNIGHQAIREVMQRGPGYLLPHFLHRDAGGTPPDDVLIIGAGSGNDVAAALTMGAKHIDAVEIDPVLNAIGRAEHPDKPYDDPRVTVHLDDGRSVLRKTTKTYDLIVYALVDSLVLHSGYSSLRLESYLFTEQALRDARASLKPGGSIVIYNYFRRGWVVGRLVTMAHELFHAEPLVFCLPYRAAIHPDDEDRGFTVLVAGDDSPGSRMRRVREAFAIHSNFWMGAMPAENSGRNGYAAREPAPPVRGHWHRIAPTSVETAGTGPTPTDSWPFLYLKSPQLPALTLRGMAVVGICSLLLLLAFAPARGARPNAGMFFLGAGFMLLESKSVVHMALLFGSTWVVNSIVFAAILVMILLANLWVIWRGPRRLGMYYSGLAIAILINALVPLDVFLGLPGAAKVIASCAVVFVPIFFAGVIFAAGFRDSIRPDVDLGSNVGGVILGGLSENFSLILGFDRLLLLALGFYAAAAILSRDRSLRAR
jgi:SAM-dependent methyltransferase